MADKLCLMASHGLVLHQGQGMGTVMQDFQPFLPSYGTKQEITKRGSLKLMPQQCGESWKLSGLPDADWFVKPISETERPALTGIQNFHPASVRFSLGIAEHFIRREKLLQFLMSGETEAERGGLDITALYDLMGLHAKSQRELIPSLIYPRSEFNTQKPLLDFVGGGLAWSSKIAVQPDGRVLFTGTGTEMEHLLSVIAEFYSLRNSVGWKKKSMLVPHFNRVENRQAGLILDETSFSVQATTLAPLKSPEKVKKKATPKQKIGKRAGKDRDLYKRNYFHACESLLSLVINRRQQGKYAILSLTRSGPELAELLTQFSAGIAGTGLAVLFCVLYKVAPGRASFCASKLLNTGVAFALVWLSGGVNRLRNTIVHISKNSKKSGLKDEEIMERVEGSLKQIYFRAATLMAVAVLRLA